jgi:hypothetical protein
LIKLDTSKLKNNYCRQLLEVAVWRLNFILIYRIAILLLCKVILWFLVVVGLDKFPSIGLDSLNGLNVPFGPNPAVRHRTFDLNKYRAMDAGAYVRIATDGYVGEKHVFAWYPLWPGLIRLVLKFVKMDPMILAVLLSNGLSVVAMLILWDTVKEEWGSLMAGWSVVLFGLFPGAVFFHLAYSESLFMVLVFSLWRGLSRGHFKMALIASCLLPLTRGPGVFVLLPIILTIVASNLDPIIVARIPRFARFIVSCGYVMPIKGYRSIALLLGPLVGWGIYLVFMRWTAGDIWAGFKAQDYFTVHSVWNLVDLPKFVTKYFQPVALHTFSGSLIDRVAFAFLVILIPSIVRFDRRMLPWVYIFGILPAMSGSFTSFLRFESTVFPIAIVLAAHVTGRLGLVGVVRANPRIIQRWAMGMTIAIAFFLAHVFFCWRIVNDRWVG